VEQDRRPTMGNGVSSDQGNLPSRDKRDVRQAVDRKQHDWSELARHPSINTQLRCLLATANSYTSHILGVGVRDNMPGNFILDRAYSRTGNIGLSRASPTSKA